MPRRFPHQANPIPIIAVDTKASNKERPNIIKAISEARAHGDLSENAEYQEARDMQAAIEERITYLEKTIKEAKIVSNDKHGDVVGLGSVVTLQKSGDKDKKEYTIVGSDEANIHDRKLSYLSPLGEALMGKKKGDEFDFETPVGKNKLKFKLLTGVVFYSVVISQYVNNRIYILL